VKLTLFLKRMKNSAMFKVWRGWLTFHNIIQEEKYGDELERIKHMEEEKLCRMKEAETSAMLKCFLKRWQNRKIAVPFMTWADIVIAKREARRLAELERQRAEAFAAMQALDGGNVAQKLKMHFAKIAGKMKQLCFRALEKHMHMKRIASMGENERFKRLKVFLEGKLKGIKFSTFKALEREAKDLMARRIKKQQHGPEGGSLPRDEGERHEVCHFQRLEAQCR
jgi:DNA phosphorothioation-dependent restriction protein DptG